MSTMQIERAVVEQALKALEAMNPYPASKEDQRASAIAALRAALAQHEPEPVVWECKDGGLRRLTQRQYDMQSDNIKRWYTRIESRFTAPPQQSAPEPVARVAEVHMSRYTLEWTNGPLPEGTELNAAPTQRKPLTEDDATELVQSVVASSERPIGMVAYGLLVTRAVEAKHGIKE